MDPRESQAPVPSNPLFLDAPSASSSRQSLAAPRSSVSTARSAQSHSGSTGGGRGSHDSKPRLSKEQHETLERHYQCEPKPSTQTKKEFSTRLGVSVEKVNVRLFLSHPPTTNHLLTFTQNWFQNRRAKTKHELKKQQETSAFAAASAGASSSAEQPSGVEQFGHPLADNHLINDAFYQTQSKPHFAGPDQMSLDQPSFSNFPTIPEEPAVIGEDPSFYNFFGLQDGDQQKVDLDTVAAIRSQFNPPSLDFDPAAALRSLQEAYNRTGSSAQLSSFTDVSSSQPSQDYSSIAGSYAGAHESSRRPSSSLVSMMPNASRTSSTSWGPQQQEHFWAGINTHGFPPYVPAGPFSDASSFQMTPSMHSRQESIVYSPTEQPDLNAAFSNAIAMPQPILPSQAMAGEQFRFPAQNHALDSTPTHEFHQSTPGAQETTQETPSRCDSGTSMLIDQPEQNQNEGQPAQSLKHSLSASTLAARRQRRPAQLGQASLRSVSYHNGPPSANDLAGTAADHNLRKIKSSTVLGGRIQKPGSAASAQRSPYAVSFDAAQRSPAQFTPNDPNSMFLWQQPQISDHAQAQAMHAQSQAQSQPGASLPMQMVDQLQNQPQFYMDDDSYAYNQSMQMMGPSMPLTPLDSQESSTPPQLQAKVTPEIQFQPYQPRDPVDPASLPPKSKNTPPRGAYQFQNFNPNSFASPRSSSLRCSTTPQ